MSSYPCTELCNMSPVSPWESSRGTHDPGKQNNGNSTSRTSNSRYSMAFMRRHLPRQYDSPSNRRAVSRAPGVGIYLNDGASKRDEGIIVTTDDSGACGRAEASHILLTKPDNKKKGHPMISLAACIKTYRPEGQRHEYLGSSTLIGRVGSLVAAQHSGRK